MSRLRLSDHKLMIETGKHRNITEDESLCPFCQRTMEDETHFYARMPYVKKI